MKFILRSARLWTSVLLVAIAATALAVAASNPSATLEQTAPATIEDAPVEPTTSGDDHKIVLCHKGNTISVDVASWPAHEAHGDRMGSCDEGACLNNADCSADEFCLTDVDLGSGGFRGWDVDHCGESGSCEPLPGPFCPAFFDPVCGCDGSTYSNDCFAHAAGVNIEFYGECGSTT
jgi:hypothetical protein